MDEEQMPGQMSIYDVVDQKLPREIVPEPLQRIRRDLYARVVAERFGGDSNLVAALLRERFGPA